MSSCDVLSRELFSSADTASAAAGESITNTQEAGVDKGGIIKAYGDLLVFASGSDLTYTVEDDSNGAIIDWDDFGHPFPFFQWQAPSSPAVCVLTITATSACGLSDSDALPIAFFVSQLRSRGRWLGRCIIYT